MAFFYLKSGFGTRTTGGGTTKQTGSFAALGAGNVYGSLAEVLADSTPPVAGDVICGSHLHAGTAASATTYNIPAGVHLVSVDDTACDTPLTGAYEETTGNNSLTVNGGFSSELWTFRSGAGATGTAHLQINQSAGDAQRHKSSVFEIGTSGNVSRIFFGSAANQGPTQTISNDCWLKFNSANQRLTIRNSSCRLVGGGVMAGGTSPTNLIELASTAEGIEAQWDGPDFSALSATTNLIDSGITQGGRVIIRNPRLPASWTGTLTNGTVPAGFRAEMYGFSTGAHTYRLWIEDYCGSIREETTRYLTAGETDGVTAVAWRMTTNANASRSNGGLMSPERGLLYSTTGAKTPVFELLSEGQLTNADISVLVGYLGNASYPLTSHADTLVGQMIAPSNLSAGAGTGAWASTSGIATPISSRLEPAFTVALPGYAIARFRLTKPNTTVYINPGPT